MSSDAEIRPSLAGVVLVAMGLGLPFMVAAFFTGLVLTDGSGWSYAWVAGGFALACLRAMSVKVERHADALIVHNMYSKRTVPIQSSTVVRPFINSAYFQFLAVHTPGKALVPMHATVLPQTQAKYEVAIKQTANRADLPLSNRTTGIVRLLLRRW